MSSIPHYPLCAMQCLSCLRCVPQCSLARNHKQSFELIQPCFRGSSHSESLQWCLGGTDMGSVKSVQLISLHQEVFHQKDILMCHNFFWCLILLFLVRVFRVFVTLSNSDLCTSWSVCLNDGYVA
jgi:hypothetical protein